MIKQPRAVWNLNFEFSENFWGIFCVKGIEISTTNNALEVLDPQIKYPRTQTFAIPRQKFSSTRRYPQIRENFRS